MPKATDKRKGKKVAPAPLAAKGADAKKKQAKKENPLFVKAPRKFGIGNLQPTRDLTRFVRWPKYVKLQRQKRVLSKRLNVPPAVNQFSYTLDKEWAKRLFTFMDKYRPETRAQKKERLAARAKAIAALPKGEKPKPEPKPHAVKFGINHVTSLVESKKARLVVIAHDVDPLEIVVWLPALCRKKGVPYCIVKSKARLGQVVHKKTAAAVALTSARSTDEAELNNLAKGIGEFYNARYDEIRRTWGGGVLGRKSRAAIARHEKAVRALEGK